MLGHPATLAAPNWATGCVTTHRSAAVTPRWLRLHLVDDGQVDELRRPVEDLGHRGPGRLQTFLASRIALGAAASSLSKTASM